MIIFKINSQYGDVRGFIEFTIVFFKTKSGGTAITTKIPYTCSQNVILRDLLLDDTMIFDQKIETYYLVMN